MRFPQGDRWSRPIDLGDAVNGATGNVEAHLGSDGTTLYFSSSCHVAAGEPSRDTGRSHIRYVSVRLWLTTRGIALH